MRLHVWTDGSGDTRPPCIGGWAFVARSPDNRLVEVEISGVEHGTTSQRMEITALFKALQWPEAPCEFVVHCDSAYVFNTIQMGWIDGWRRNGWKKREGEDVKNRDLWEAVDKYVRWHTSVQMVKVKGHSDEKLNNLADELAGKARKEAWRIHTKGC